VRKEEKATTELEKEAEKVFPVGGKASNKEGSENNHDDRRKFLDDSGPVPAEPASPPARASAPTNDDKPIADRANRARLDHYLGLVNIPLADGVKMKMKMLLARPSLGHIAEADLVRAVVDAKEGNSAMLDRLIEGQSK
jgi:hypothetical protein